jgi:hypothetical protein
MKYKSVGIINLVLVTLLIAGCRMSPIYEVRDSALNPSSQATQEDVGRAIVTAGQSLGWQMKEEEPGHILGTLYLRSHVAVVDVFYTTSDFSILYKDSTNLKYDGKNIHSNYNGWIQNLSNAIVTQVGNL